MPALSRRHFVVSAVVSASSLLVPGPVEFVDTQAPFTVR